MDRFLKTTDNWARGINPLDFQATYDDSIEWYGISRDCVRDVFDCDYDAVLDGTESSAVRPFRPRTTDLDTFKAWIGLPDDYIRSGKALPYDRNQNLNYDPRFEDPNADLSAVERNDIYVAAGRYLFGDSEAVAAYRSAIELHMAPFEIAVYAVDKLIMRSSGSLSIQGPPSVLIVRKLNLIDGSSLKTKTITRVLSDKMVKFGQSDLAETHPSGGTEHGY
ncbi:MAG: hypothetical protein QOI12_691 [Alphaproteobacteria bacterium]|jgi:hypothetical protein|nr:hypothetical protein [Alphaproteobacteria bacterium]